MRGILVCTLLLLLLAFPSSGYPIDLGDIAPDFKVVAMDGRKISYFSDLKGKKPLYLVFWATW